MSTQAGDVSAHAIAAPIFPTMFFAFFGLPNLSALALLFAFAVVVGHLREPVSFLATLAGLLVIGMIPFVLLGLAIGYLASPTVAAPVANLISLPLSFASGLFVPVRMLPASVQLAAPFLPSYHVAELGWTLLGAGDGGGYTTHLAWIAAYSAGFLVLAVVAYRRDEGKTFE